MKQRLVLPECLIGLRRLDLRGVQASNGGLRIGALTTHDELERAPALQAAPLLAETYHHVASQRIRNAATVGGGLAHADPSQDPPPSLMVLGASVTVTSRGGSRQIPLNDFFRDYYETALQPGEVLTEVQVPAQPAGSGAVYIKFLPRTADDYATVSVAALVTLGAGGVIADARIALGAVAATPVRASQAEAALRGQRPTPELLRAAAQTVAKQVDPLSDFRGSAEYKRDMAVVWTRRALEQALQRASRLQA